MGVKIINQLRVQELLTEHRCLSGTLPSEVNSVRGLFELMDHLHHFDKYPPRSVIEIGVDQGISTEVWCMFCDRVVGVDNGIDPEDARLSPYGNFQFVRGASPGALEQFADGEFDMCYIDGDHNYAPCIADIIACWRIVKPNGWIAGHDWQHLSVQRAVRKILGQVRVHIFTDMSWLVRRPAAITLPEGALEAVPLNAA